jgi:hypothetical protein
LTTAAGYCVLWMVGGRRTRCGSVHGLFALSLNNAAHRLALALPCA